MKEKEVYVIFIVLKVLVAVMVVGGYGWACMLLPIFTSRTSKFCVRAIPWSAYTGDPGATPGPSTRLQKFFTQPQVRSRPQG